MQTKQIQIVNLADDILAKYEDDNEYHFHKVDRVWLIKAMIEFSQLILENNETYGSKGSDETKTDKL